MAEQPQHWPTERMINEGHADFATREDLEGVDDTVLLETAEICLVTEAAPDECIPCWAYAEYMERQQQKLASLAPQIKADEIVPDDEVYDEQGEFRPTPALCGVENPDYPGEYSCTFPKGHGPIPDDEEPDEVSWDHAAPNSGAWWTMPSTPPAFKTLDLRPLPPVERLRAQVETLATTLDEILHGPPIPPKEVSLTELALLSLGAERWVKMTEAQGVDLSSEQQQVLDSTKALVARLRS